MGKIFVGLVFFLSSILVISFCIGFFYQGMTIEYIEKNGLFIFICTLVAIVFAIPAWKWRKETAEALIFLTLPF